MSSGDGALNDLERAIIDFERTWWQEPGRKDVAVRQRLDLSPTRYYELLNHLLEKPDAMEYDPMVVRRLQRLRDRRRRVRVGGESHERGGAK